MASLGFRSIFPQSRYFITASLQTYYTIYLRLFKLTTQSTGILSNLLHNLLVPFQTYYTNYLCPFTSQKKMIVLVQSHMYPFNFPSFSPPFTSNLVKVLTTTHLFLCDIHKNNDYLMQSPFFPSNLPYSHLKNLPTYSMGFKKSRRDLKSILFIIHMEVYSLLYIYLFYFSLI